MPIKNLSLSFLRQEDDKMIFRTETGLEVAIARELLGDFKAGEQKFYLNLDQQPFLASEANQKQILNELLGNKDN
jgi:hypothetical protein